MTSYTLHARPRLQDLFGRGILKTSQHLAITEFINMETEVIVALSIGLIGLGNLIMRIENVITTRYKKGGEQNLYYFFSLTFSFTSFFYQNVGLLIDLDRQQRINFLSKLHLCTL